MKFLGQGFQALEHKQDRQTPTDATEHITTATFKGGKNVSYHNLCTWKPKVHTHKISDQQWLCTGFT